MSKFATAINCMDGRVQIPVIEYIKNNYGVNYVDMITAPGVNKLLSEGEHIIMELIKKSVGISVNFHGSKLIAIVGHYDCAGNPTDKETQLKHILTGIKMVISWGFNVKVIGLWVNEDWEVCEVE
jgi:carbonic anhydrase